MMNFSVKMSIIFLATFILSGCGILSSSQKTELDLVKNISQEQDENIQAKQEKNEEDVEKEGKDIVEEQSEEVVGKNESSEAEVKLQEKISQEENKVDKAESKFEIKNKLVSWGFTASQNRKIDTIIIHSSYNAVGDDVHNLDDIIYKEYKPYGVSPHYIVSREGKIYRLVEDKNIAYHAGVSKVPDGRTGVNAFSLGIEIVNTKSEKPNEAQYEALRNLLDYLKGEYKIKYVLGHSDIAPGRKDDPWNFDFNKIK
jgi:hypothetical protein